MDRNAPARTTPRRVPFLFVGLPVLSAAIAALAYRWLAPSSSTAVTSTETVRSQHRDVLGDAVVSTVWPAYGQAAFIKTGQTQIEAGPNQQRPRSRASRR
jgi:hypothetical protein